MCKVCLEILRPFYGWIGYFCQVVVAGVFHSLYDRGGEWLLVLCILCTIANIPLDVYITYLYFFGNFSFLYLPDLKVQLSFIGLALVTFIFSVVFIWSAGKGIIILMNEYQDRFRANSTRSNQIMPESSSAEMVLEFASAESKDSPEEWSRNSLADVTAENQVPKINPFVYFKFLCDCLFLLAVGPAQLYLVYFYIVRCIVVAEMAIYAKLVVAGFLLPILLTCISSKNIYRIMSRPWYTHCAKPVLMGLALITVLAGTGSVWFSALSFYTMEAVAADPAADGQIEVYKTDTDAQSPSVLMYTSESSFHLIYAKEVLQHPNVRKSMKYKCSESFQTENNLQCSEITFGFEYKPTVHRIFHDHVVKYAGNTTPQDSGLQWNIGWSCSLCLHDSALAAVKNVSTIQGVSQNPADTLENKEPASCANIPDWLFYLLTGYTFLVTILFMALLTLAMMAKNKHETRHRLAAQEEAEKRFIRRMSSKVSNDQQIQAPLGSQTLPSLPEEAAPPSPYPPRRTSTSATTFREIAKAAVRVPNTATGIALNQLSMIDAAKLLRYSKPPRIIRVPKGTSLDSLPRFSSQEK